MRGAERTPPPDRIRHVRETDLRWLRENLHVLWPAAERKYAAQGRGAIVIVATVLVDSGHPFYYLTVDELVELEEAEAVQMANAYDPASELVALLIKPELISTYRVGVPAARKDRPADPQHP